MLCLKKFSFESSLYRFWNEATPLQFCTLLFFLSRALIFFGVWYAHNTSLGHLGYLDSLLKWDAGWYLSIVHSGYSTSNDFTIKQNYAFFPLYPLTIIGFSKVTTLSPEVSGILLSNLFFSFSLCGFYKLLQHVNLRENTIRFAVILLTISPENIYFITIYTESLFFMLSVFAMLFAYQRKWFLACFFAMLLGACRPNGVLIAIPFLWLAYQDFKIARQFDFKWLWFCIIPFGLIAYMLYLQHHVGDYLIFMHVQQAWARMGWQLGEHGKHIHYILKDLKNLWVGQEQHNFMAFILLIITAVYLWKSDYIAESLFLIALIFPSLSSGSGDSLMRYSLVLYPFYLALALWAKDKKFSQVFLLMISSFLLGANILGWVQGAWLT